MKRIEEISVWKRFQLIMLIFVSSVALNGCSEENRTTQNKEDNYLVSKLVSSEAEPEDEGLLPLFKFQSDDFLSGTRFMTSSGDTLFWIANGVLTAQRLNGSPLWSVRVGDGSELFSIFYSGRNILCAKYPVGNKILAVEIDSGNIQSIIDFKKSSFVGYKDGYFFLFRNGYEKERVLYRINKSKESDSLLVLPIVENYFDPKGFLIFREQEGGLDYWEDHVKVLECSSFSIVYEKDLGEIEHGGVSVNVRESTVCIKGANGFCYNYVDKKVAHAPNSQDFGFSSGIVFIRELDNERTYELGWGEGKKLIFTSSMEFNYRLFTYGKRAVLVYFDKNSLKIISLNSNGISRKFDTGLSVAANPDYYDGRFLAIEEPLKSGSVEISVFEIPD